MEARQTLWLAFFLLELRTVLFGLLLISSLASLSTKNSQEDHIWKDLSFSPLEGCCWDQSLGMLRIMFMRITFTRFTVEKTCLFRRWRGCRVGARSLGGKYNSEQEEDDRLQYRLLEMITVLSFFHCQRVGGLVLGASEENTIQSRKKMIGFSIGYWR